MMGDMNVHGEEDFTSGKMAVGRVVRGVELGFGEIRDYAGAVLEGVAEEFDDGVLLRGRWHGGRLRILQAGAELVVSRSNVGHQLAEVHRFRMRTESVLVWRHGLRHIDGETTES